MYQDKMGIRFPAGFAIARGMEVIPGASHTAPRFRPTPAQQLFAEGLGAAMHNCIGMLHLVGITEQEHQGRSWLNHAAALRDFLIREYRIDEVRIKCRPLQHSTDAARVMAEWMQMVQRGDLDASDFVFLSTLKQGARELMGFLPMRQPVVFCPVEVALLAAADSSRERDTIVRRLRRAGMPAHIVRHLADVATESKTPWSPPASAWAA